MNSIDLFFSQHFALFDLFLIVIIALVQLALSVDNVIVLGNYYNDCPSHLRKKMVWIGIASASFLRLLVILAGSLILNSKPVLFVGSVYLIYIAIQSFFPSKKNKITLSTYFKIELVDLLFSIDSLIISFVIISIGYHATDIQSKLWLIYLGTIIGLFLTRFAALSIAQKIGAFPIFIKLANILVGLIGLTLSLKIIFDSNEKAAEIINRVSSILLLVLFMVFVGQFLALFWQKRIFYKKNESKK